jgi:hypothetical protein
MTKFAAIIMACLAATLVGIVALMPLVVAFGMLGAGLTLLLALVSYFEAAH